MQQTQERRLTYEDYYHLSDQGAFGRGHTELIHGRVISKPAMGEPECVAVILAEAALTKSFRQGYVVRPRFPLRTGTEEEPEPDLAVIAGDVRDTLITGRPRSALLVVEVAVGSLAFDLGEKAEVYAGAGIEEYWVLEVEPRRVHVHRRTIPDAALPRGRRYSQIEVLDESASVAPLAMPNRPIRISDLLP